MFLYSKKSVPWETRDYKQTNIIASEIINGDCCMTRAYNVSIQIFGQVLKNLLRGLKNENASKSGLLAL